MYLNGIFSNLIGEFTTICISKITEHAGLVSGIFLGLIIGYSYNLLTGARSIRLSYERTINEQRDRINDLKEMVNHRLNDIKVEPKDQDFFKRLRKFFRIKVKSSIKKS
jgi:uncharacterized protein YjiS (DUF1127 family)